MKLMHEMAIKHVRGPSIEQIIKDLDNQKKSLQNKVKNLAEEATEYMRSQIKPHRAGSTGNLAESVEAVISVQENLVTVGIGVDRSKAPYWSVVNYGGYVPPRPPSGAFTGGTQKPDKSLGGNGTQAFKPGFRNYSFKPMHAIRPMNYIEKTQIWLNKKIKKIFK